MTVTMLKGKIHRATVVQSELDYVGSITYTIAGEPGSGMICLNGAAARCASRGDKVIIMAYAQMTPEEAKTFSPKVVFVDEKNQISRITRYEKHGQLFQAD